MPESSIETTILTITEPTIQLDELSIPDTESGTDNAQSEPAASLEYSKMLSFFPLARINEYEIQSQFIETMTLSHRGFVPTIKLSFKDMTGLFQSRHYPKDGDVLQFFLRSQGEENTFKPIRMDFTIVDCKPIGGGGGTQPNSFNIFGVAYIPNLFTESMQALQSTSFDALLDIATELQLGFASNIEQTADEQKWVNSNDETRAFIKNIASQSYLNDDSFMTAYIDTYYIMNFVEVNRLFSQEGAVEISESFSSAIDDVLGQSNSETDEFPNLLTNQTQFNRSARYIKEKKMKNNTGSVSIEQGYKKYTQYWDHRTKEFVSEFVDPLTTDEEGYINATKGRVINGRPEGPRDEQVRYKYLGSQTENVHENYIFAMVQNKQNLQETDKMGMTVDLTTINPAVLRYSRMYCHFVEYTADAKMNLKQTQREDGTNLELEEGNDNAAERETSPEIEGSGGVSNPGAAIVNEFLSGFYVISGFDFVIEEPNQPVFQRLYMQRRAFKPTT
tara:strand:+ start:979 stop:2490 length:1512 start_codon:yes stop_codon:yes gene_type:complete